MAQDVTLLALCHCVCGVPLTLPVLFLAHSKRDKGYVAALTVFMAEDGTHERDVSGLVHCTHQSPTDEAHTACIV